MDAMAVTKTPYLENDFEPYPYMYRPIIDDFTSKPFLHGEPLDLIGKGDFNQVPMMIGFNRDEGLLSVDNFQNNETLRNLMLDNWDTYMPIHLIGR